jgi:hypothetical protein
MTQRQHAEKNEKTRHPTASTSPYPASFSLWPKSVLSSSHEIETNADRKKGKIVNSTKIK